jgi:hypothetical protein
MNRITKKIRPGLSRQVAFSRRLSRAVLTTLAVTSLILAATSARAACGSFSRLGSGSPMNLPMLGAAGGDEEGYSNGAHDPIVGLWHVVYTSGGKLFNESLDQWHSDGTEFENAFLAPAQGNICFGVWKPTGWRTVILHHVGWTFDPASPTATANGTFTLDEENKVSSDGKSYTGTFTFKTFDLNGVQGPEVITGTIAATRITVS